MKSCQARGSKLSKLYPNNVMANVANKAFVLSKEKAIETCMFDRGAFVCQDPLTTHTRRIAALCVV